MADRPPPWLAPGPPPAHVLEAAELLDPGGIHRVRGETITVSCPVHGPERHPSLTIWAVDWINIGLKCWAECDQGDLERAANSRGIATDWTVGAPLPRGTGLGLATRAPRTDGRQVIASERNWAWAGPQAEPHPPPLARFDLPQMELEARKKWAYTASGKTVMYQVLYGYTDGGGQKSYRPWTYQKYGEENIPRLRPGAAPAEARPWLVRGPGNARTLLIVEGERTCDAAAELMKDVQVASAWGGAGGMAKQPWETDSFPSVERIAIVPDDDAAGRKAAELLRERMQKRERRTTRIVDPATIPKMPSETTEGRLRGWDLADLITETDERALAEWREGLPPDNVLHKP